MAEIRTKTLVFDPNPLFAAMVEFYESHKDIIYPETISENFPEGNRTRVIFCNEGATRSSKTFDFYHFLVWFCSNHRGMPLNIYVIRKTLKSCREIAFKSDFIKCMRLMNHYSPRFVRNENVSPEYLLGNSWIKFRGLDGDEEFGDNDIVFFNEALDIDNEKTVLNILQRNTTLACFDWNPKYTHHWIFDWEGRQNVLFTKTSFRNNKHIPAAVLTDILSWCPWDFTDWDEDNNRWKYPERPENRSELKRGVRYRRPNVRNIRNKTVDRWRWMVYGEGLRTPDEGAIFKQITWIDKFPSECEEVKFGLDFGYSQDPSVLIKVGRTGMDLYVEYMTYECTPSPDDLFALADPIIMQEIAKRKEKAGNLEYERVNVICDSQDKFATTGVNFVTALNETKYLYKRPYDFFKASKVSIVLGLSAVKRFNLHVVDTKPARMEFENYCNKVVEGNVTNTPIDKFNHGIDPLRYVVMQWWFMLVKDLVPEDLEN